MSEIGVTQPLCPGIGPPCDIHWLSEAPGAGLGVDIAEAGGLRPAEQPASRIGFAPFERATSWYSWSHRVNAALGGCQVMAE
jgi:hypothetical protein